jgi:hypothetical protein
MRVKCGGRGSAAAKLHESPVKPSHQIDAFSPACSENLELAAENGLQGREGGGKQGYRDNNEPSVGLAGGRFTVAGSALAAISVESGP